MNITTKTLYGIQTIVDIAWHVGQEPVQRKHIAARQKIPTDVMDVILTRLRNRGLIQSFRGRDGGYRLALSPEEISALNILEAVEDLGGDFLSRPDALQGAAKLAVPAWASMDLALRRQLRRYSVADMLEEINDNEIPAWKTR